MNEWRPSKKDCKYFVRNESLNADELNSFGLENEFACVESARLIDRKETRSNLEADFSCA